MYTEKELKELEDKVLKAKIALKLTPKDAFFAVILAKHRVMRDDTIHTMAIDNKKNILWSPSFVERMTPKELRVVLKHEIMHYSLKHILLKHTSNELLIACDVKVNALLLLDGEELSQGVVTPKITSQANKTYNFIFTNLDGDTDCITDCQTYTAKSLEEELIRKRIDTSQFMLDDIYGDDGNSNDTLNVDIDNTEAMNIAAQFNTQSDRQAVTAAIKESMRRVSTNWKGILARFFTSFGERKQTWKRTSRKYASMRLVLPGSTPAEQCVGVLHIDVSSSMNVKIIRAIFAECRRMVQLFRNIHLHVLVANDRIVDQYDIKSNSDLDEMINKIKKGGGTSHKEVYEYVNKHKPQFLISATDGYSDIDVTSKGCLVPTIFLVNKDYARIVHKYGTVVRMELA